MGNGCGYSKPDINDQTNIDLANGTPIEKQEIGTFKYSSNKKIKVHINGKNYASENIDDDHGINIPQDAVNILQIIQQQQNQSFMKRQMDFSKSSRSMNRVTNLAQSQNQMNNESTFMQTPQRDRNTKLNSSINNTSTKKGTAKTDDIFNMRQSFQMSAVREKLIQSEVFKEASGSLVIKKKSKNERDLEKLMSQVQKRLEKRIIIENDKKMALQKKNTQKGQVQEEKKQLPIDQYDNEILKYIMAIDKCYLQIDEEDILFEGDQMKYIPGFQNSYFNRYCLANKNEFKYYKNELMSVKHVFPLVSITIDDILKVERVRVELPPHSQLEDTLNYHQFEIFLKEKDVESSLRLPKNYIEEQKVNITNLSSISIDIPNRVNRFSRKNRNLQLYGHKKERKELESAERKYFKTNATRHSSQTRFCNPNHMMPRMVASRQKRCRSYSEERKQQKQSEQELKILRPINLENVQKQINDPQIEHFIDSLEQSLAIPQQFEKYEVKNPASWIKNLSGINTWTNREVEWQLAEDRLLFSCLSDIECDRWVTILTYLMCKRAYN